jgi:hypothetical protein
MDRERQLQAAEDAWRRLPFVSRQGISFAFDPTDSEACRTSGTLYAMRFARWARAFPYANPGQRLVDILDAFGRIGQRNMAERAFAYALGQLIAVNVVEAIPGNDVDERPAPPR